MNVYTVNMFIGQDDLWTLWYILVLLGGKAFQRRCRIVFSELWVWINMEIGVLADLSTIESH